MSPVLDTTGPVFTPWPKVPRLNRDIVISEKIDGTNAAVGVTEDGRVYAQSRTRIITPDSDNFGFARWVSQREADLRDFLGVGLHFGEWWGNGIQRTYGRAEKLFSLFNTERWALEADREWPEQVRVVPVLYEGPYSQNAIEDALALLRTGSVASPGFPRAEGIVVFHKAARQMFKVLLENDDLPKSVAA